MAIEGDLQRSAQATPERDAAEFIELLGSTARNLKSVGPPPAQLHEGLMRAGLGPRHMPPLLAVALAGPLSVSELAARLGLRLSTTSTIVGQLSRAGLLERVEDEEDRRRTIVHLHSDHREELQAWLKRAMTPVLETMRQLSPQARAHFMEGWRTLHSLAAEAASPGDKDDCGG